MLHPRPLLKTVSTFTVVVLSLLAANEAAFAQPDPNKGKLIEMKWVSDKKAKETGLRSRYGILYYFPPKDGERDHVIFKTEEMCDLSRSSPMVKIKPSDKKLQALREEFSVPEKYPVIVVTDWFGNPMQTFAARKLNDKKFKFEAIRRAISRADVESMKTESRLEKDVAKAEAQLKQRKYPQTIRALEWAATVHGWPKAERAKEIMEEVIEIGREKLGRALENPADDTETQKKVLRKIARDFKGTPVKDEADAEVGKLNKAAEEE